MISEIGKGDCLVRVFGVADEINILVGVVVNSFCVIADVDTPSVAGGVCVVGDVRGSFVVVCAVVE